MFCDIQQELIILAGTDKCLTSLKMNSIHFEDRRLLQTTKTAFDSPYIHAMSVLTFDSPGSKFRSRCYTVGVHIRNSFVVGLDATEQPLILVCLLTALKLYSVRWF